jgi:hypothetical protein
MNLGKCLACNKPLKRGYLCHAHLIFKDQIEIRKPHG